MAGLFSLRAREPSSLPVGYRVYAVGDIHGSLVEFEELLHLLQEDDRSRDDARTLLVLLGDLIDRGPASSDVLRLAMAPRGWAEQIALMGNHEAALLEALGGNEQMLDLWLLNGGDAALNSWGLQLENYDQQDSALLIEAVRDVIPSDQLSWLRSLKLSLHLGDYFFVHAGIKPGLSLLDQAEHDNLWIRDTFLRSGKDHGAVIVHGHSISPSFEDLPNRIAVDTGAYKTGRLTAVGLEGSKRWFIDTKARDV